jgi:GTP-binding protein HflX
MTDSRTAPPAVERAALVSVVTGSARRADAEVSLAELAGLADAAGATVVLTTVQERSAAPTRPPSSARGKVQSLAAAVRRGRHRRGHLRQRAVAGAAAAPRGRAEVQGRRSHAADPRHLRAPRPHARRQAPGRAGAAQIPAASAGRIQHGAVASRRRHRHARPGETKLETDRRRIRARIDALQREIDQVRQRRSQLRERREKRAVPTVALVGYTNAGKTTLFNR